MNIAKNQSEFLKSKLVDSLGSNDYGQGIENAIDRVLYNAGKIWTDKMRKNLEDFRTSRGFSKKASGVLEQSIRSDVAEYSDKVTLKIYLEDYYINVNDGRKGTRQSWRDNPKFMIGKRNSKAKLPPFEEISQWVRNKGVKSLSQTSLGFKTRQTSRVSDKLKKARLIDAIRWSIRKNGVEPTYFYTQVINDKSIEDLKNIILKSTGKALVVDIKRYK